jgi:hypothetical protein
VEELRRNYTIRELKQMDEARRLYVIMGRPSKVDFLQMLRKGKLLENPVRIEDFYNAERVYDKRSGSGEREDRTNKAGQSYLRYRNSCQRKIKHCVGGRYHEFYWTQFPRNSIKINPIHYHFALMRS